MKTLQPYIDLGWHTVPLKGTLARLEDGTKTIPQFEKDWKNTYKHQFNPTPATLGGAMTGEVSNIIAIDCDNQATLDLFMAQANNYKFVFHSLGKPQGGGTIIYEYTPDIPSFSIHDSDISLDFYSNDGFVYLPTDANKTKVKWKQETLQDLPDITPPPDAIAMLLRMLHKQYELAKAPREARPTIDNSTLCNFLQPQVELFVTRGFTPSLFKIITPKDFRDTETYIKLGYLHPGEVPEGRGSEYLSKISAIFGADPSIDTKLYYSAMKAINALWAQPMDSRRLEATIVKRMIDGEAKINGEAIWKYDDNWRTKGLTFTNKLGEAIEVFFNDERLLYYQINYTKDRFSTFSRDGDIMSYMETVGIGLPGRKELKGMMPITRTKANPSIPFGFFKEDEYTKMFNTFKQTPALAIISNPEVYSQYYIRPETTIKFFESLIPDHNIMDYLLGFLKRKLSTFSYSPIVLYFLGVPGSGKDTFVNILSHIMGEQYVARPSAKEFLEQYNGWMLDTYFVQLDEYGNQLHRMTDKAEALGKIKAYSGKPEVQIREMRCNGYMHQHSATFIMTANSNPLLLEEDDRRVVLLDTPNPIASEDWVKQAGGIDTVHSKIMEEINDFCYYLATEVKSISPNDYVTPPASDAKKEVIADKLTAGARIVFCFKNQMYANLEELCYEYDIPTLFEAKNNSYGQVDEESVYDLYYAMTEGNGNKRALAKYMRDGGFTKVPTTRNGRKAYVYKMPELKHFEPTPFEGE